MADVEASAPPQSIEDEPLMYTSYPDDHEAFDVVAGGGSQPFREYPPLVRQAP